jgi:hypothetical protein
VRSGIRRRPVLALGVVVLVAVLVAVAAVVVWSGAKLAGDPTSLARLKIEAFGGKLVSATAVDSHGRSVPLSIENGRLTPRTQVSPGERISVEVVLRRPGWLGWALGHTHRERLSVDAPVPQISDRWLTVPGGSQLPVHFDQPVTSVAYVSGGGLQRRQVSPASATVSLPRTGASGSIQVAAAVHTWERLSRPVTVTWFPPSRRPAALASPRVGGDTSPLGQIRLTLSKPVREALGQQRPKLTPKVAGHWSEPDSHTLVFTPTGFGAGLGSHVRMDLPRPIAVDGRETRELDWTVPPGSTTRLQQLLAEGGYLPVDWKSAAPATDSTWRGQLAAAVNAPTGNFSWRYGNVPPELRRMWKPGQPNDVTRGAVMMFQDEHHLTVDGLAGPQVWHALIADTLAGKRRDAGYSYVYVHRTVPQSLNLWHNGHKVLSSPGNTGVPAAPTQLGTFPVFEHIAVGTMSGTNPDGSKYHDPGIRWISYFNGGDAIHAFNRASFGTPQSLGCVELPLASAKKVWPYTPIGTLVTIEN